MVDETQPRGGSTASVCPWCSAAVTGTPENCPSCGATLDAGDAVDPALPGLTAIDAAAIVRAKQQPTSRQRNRLLSWISGEYPDEEGLAAQAGALAPPDADVRREMLRLELEAEVAALQAEAGAIRAEAAVGGHEPGASPAAAAAAEQVTADLDAIEAELVRVDEALETDPLGVPPTPDAAAAEADDADAGEPDAAVAEATATEAEGTTDAPEPADAVATSDADATSESAADEDAPRA